MIGWAAAERADIASPIDISDSFKNTSSGPSVTIFGIILKRLRLK
jgi:hypothetical protein